MGSWCGVRRCGWGGERVGHASARSVSTKRLRYVIHYLRQDCWSAQPCCLLAQCLNVVLKVASGTWIHQADRFDIVKFCAKIQSAIAQQLPNVSPSELAIASLDFEQSTISEHVAFGIVNPPAPWKYRSRAENPLGSMGEVSRQPTCERLCFTHFQVVDWRRRKTGHAGHSGDIAECVGRTPTDYLTGKLFRMNPQLPRRKAAGCACLPEVCNSMKTW